MTETAELLATLPQSHGENDVTQAELIAGPATFTRMFDDLEPFAPDEKALVALAATMRDEGQSSDHPFLPAGYTYFGQFVDHDITLDLTPLAAQAGADLGVNFRTPRLDLDSLYGLGRDGTPFLYQPFDKDQLVIGRNDDGRPFDLPRLNGATAVIGDPRNDENLVVAQLHRSFINAHNKLLTTIVRPNLPGFPDHFGETERILTFHYQWIVLHDFLKRITEPGVVDDVLANGRQFFHFDPDEGPRIPVEFSVAAYRFGHSLVRDSYNYNRNFPSASLFELFGFTHFTVPSIWIADWRRMLPVIGHDIVPGGMNHARRIDPFIARTLHTLPGEQGINTVLPARNLIRGVQKGLPTGQDVAARMGLPVMSPDDLSDNGANAAVVNNDFHHHSPLWWYLLKEAQITSEGRNLGPVGSRIVAEVFVGILEGDPHSFLSVKRDWQPELPHGVAGSYELADLFNLLVPLNPLG